MLKAGTVPGLAAVRVHVGAGVVHAAPNPGSLEAGRQTCPSSVWTTLKHLGRQGWGFGHVSVPAWNHLVRGVSTGWESPQAETPEPPPPPLQPSQPHHSQGMVNHSPEPSLCISWQVVSSRITCQEPLMATVVNNGDPLASWPVLSTWNATV